MSSQNIIVTGATSGIGRAIAAHLCRKGHHVIALGRRTERLEELKQNLREAKGTLQTFSVDLRDIDAISNVFEQVSSIDVLINNAGLGHASSLIDGDPNDWRETFDVNVLALSICTQKAVQNMIANDIAGNIIHISSMSAHRVPQGSGMYSASKFAVRSLTEGLRKELRERNLPIRVTAISPGFVETEFAENYHKSEEKAQEIYSQYQVLHAYDIAHQVDMLINLPPHVEIHDILMRPTQQSN
mgnify:CR=1 FL=1